MSTSEEVWKPIPLWEGLYEVSNLGRVRSTDRLVRHKANGTQCKRGKILRCHPNRAGYLQVDLFQGNRRTHLSIHRLVLEAFVGPRPDGMQCRHLDGNPQNNRLDNLAWGTPKENSEDTKAHGRHKAAVRKSWTQLTKEQRRERNARQYRSLKQWHKQFGRED